MNKVFPNYRDKTLEGFQTLDNPTLEIAAQRTREYITDIKYKREHGIGLTLVGQNGIGKTHLACCVLSAAQEAGYRIECIELATWIDLWQEMFRISDEDRIDSLNEQLRYIRRVHFLLLDDLGREHESASGWSNHRVFDLLRYRHNRNLPTILTTNVPLPLVEQRYSEGLSSFLTESSVIVVMHGEDFRGQGPYRD